MRAKRLLTLAVAVILIIVITKTSSSYGSQLMNTAKETALFSAMLAMPDGYYVNLKNAANREVSGYSPSDNNSESENIPEPELESSNSSDTVSVPETAIGKVVSKFVSPYTVKLNYNNVYIRNLTSKTIDLKAELDAGPALRMNMGTDPEVLIIHTHATESYMNEDRNYYTDADKSRTTDESKNVIKVGNIIGEQLKSYGISFVHDKTLHDYPSYTGSYDNAEVTTKEYLKRYPSIKVVLDVHRDAIGGGGSDKVKPVTEINGKKSAQVMLVLGCEDGKVSGFPKWKENFRLGAKVQQMCEVMYPGLARAVHFAPKKYNQHLSNGSMILEMGTDANTLEEASYAGELLGKVLGETLAQLKK